MGAPEVRDTRRQCSACQHPYRGGACTWPNVEDEPGECPCVGESPCFEPGHPTKWTMHVHGPDDLIYFDTEEAARRTAQDMTEWWAQLDHSSPMEPTMEWHVIPPLSAADPSVAS